ncbi:MAG: hypothetical protein ACK4NS_11580 [Saprospiraceae bacterium]
MYKYILQSLEGIQWFGITALLIFFGVFCFAAINTALKSRKDTDRMARLPLED